MAKGPVETRPECRDEVHVKLSKKHGFVRDRLITDNLLPGKGAVSGRKSLPSCPGRNGESGEVESCFTWMIGWLAAAAPRRQKAGDVLLGIRIVARSPLGMPHRLLLVDQDQDIGGHAFPLGSTPSHAARARRRL